MIASPLIQPVAQVREILRGLAAPWAICGGWAIDLWLDRPLRDHADVDVAVFRDDQGAAREHLQRRGWMLSVARDGGESPWSAGTRLEPPDHEIWCRHPTEALERFEILLNERTEDSFVFRRDLSLRMSLGEAFRHTASGFTVLSPAIVLLYKAKHPSPTSELDFDAAASELDANDRSWLRHGLAGLSPHHPWLRRLPA